MMVGKGVFFLDLKKKKKMSGFLSNIDFLRNTYLLCRMVEFEVDACTRTLTGYLGVLSHTHTRSWPCSGRKIASDHIVQAPHHQFGIFNMAAFTRRSTRVRFKKSL